MTRSSGSDYSSENPDRGLAPATGAATGQREPLADGREHLTVSGKFRSDKYPWCHDNFVPLKVTDPMAQGPLRTYALDRASTDLAFSKDLLEALGEPLPAPPESENG